MDWSLVAGAADLLRVLGAHVHSLLLFPSVHAEGKGEAPPLSMVAAGLLRVPLR